MHRRVNQPLPEGELSIQHDGVLRKLCGADWKNKMVLAYNYREEAGPGISSKYLQEHEDELKEGFWKHVTMVDKIQRFDFHDRRKSAWKILWPLMRDTPSDLGNKLVSSTTGLFSASRYGWHYSLASRSQWSGTRSIKGRRIVYKTSIKRSKKLDQVSQEEEYE